MKKCIWFGLVAIGSIGAAAASEVRHVDEFSEENSCKVTVDPDKVEAEVPRTLYGTGMEDVNHEIYGGLDAQRLYDESFEESLPPQTLVHGKRGSGLKVCGRQWESVLSGGGVSP